MSEPVTERPGCWGELWCLSRAGHLSWPACEQTGLLRPEVQSGAARCCLGGPCPQSGIGLERT